MSVVRFAGGLGNQMFQYAFGKKLMLHGCDVVFEMNWYKPDRSRTRPFVLDKFHTKVKKGSFSQSCPMIREGRSSVIGKYKGYNFSGYWQNPKYYEGTLPILKKEFCVKEEFYTDEFLKLREEISNCNAVAVHVRRGDFMNCDFYTMTMDYYSKAIEFITVVKKVDRIYVFSDDMEWCKENFKDVTFVSSVNYLDLELMKHCKHFIIQGNSSFSLWPIYLNDNPERMVILPSKSRLRADDHSLYENKGFPEDWLKL